MRYLLLGILLGGVGSTLAWAQQKIGYIDSEHILNRLPEYQDAQQRLERMAQEWQRELERMQRELEQLVRDYQAREVLYTEEMRRQKRQEIVDKERLLEQFREQKFGPQGELFQQQAQLLRPIQERILRALREVAEAQGYDFVFDKSGSLTFLYVRPQHDLSALVLERLGVNAASSAR
ncbi:MAG: OmpH family outer membrane protein [Bacteroidetes bacterium]|nr:OmpH family outer membrane protein [Rhodothermia bacterium]MCS7155189.1 OmpH family outer membrane protein [Bacteroidota bacterium]MCX7906184.1 OmpH family outer membrane protein [Bacteroidota bacterium]MDW8138311.1 OmpH family outer membrane protein [Bacteroidota bacterium]MDW8285996.1 OmpH family outer membrane protein [Bacteroidota bacterium]